MQEIRWPGASTPRAGLVQQLPAPPPSSPPGATTHAADGSSSDQRTSGAPTPTAADASRRESRPASPLRCLHGSTRGKNAARQGAACLRGSSRMRGYRHQGAWGVGGHASDMRPMGGRHNLRPPRRRGSVTWPMILHRHACGRQTLSHLLAHARGQRAPSARFLKRRKRGVVTVGRCGHAQPAPACLIGGTDPARLARRSLSGWLPPGRVGL